LSLCVFVVLATLNSAGYRYGASDQAFYVPAVLEQLNPSLYPEDTPLIESQARLTVLDETVAGMAQASSASLPILFAALYLLALAILALAAASVGSFFYRTRWAAAALLAALTLRHAITRSGTNTLEGYFHPRQLAFALGIVAVAAVLRGRIAASIVVLGIGALMHPTTTLWFGIWLGVAVFASERRWRPFISTAAALACGIGLWSLYAGPLSGRLVQMDPTWLETLRAKDYLFPLDWPAHAWLINLAYPPLILWIYFRRRAAGVMSPRETALVIGCLSLVLVFAVALVFHLLRLAIAVQLQPARAFWMLDFLATVYVVWALCEWPGATPRRAAVAAVAILAASIARSAYFVALRLPERAVAQIALPDNDWGRAMRWARASEPNSQWLADPLHAARYGTSLRLAGERDVFVEELKDTAIGMYDRSIALRTRDRLRALGDFRTLSPDRALALASRYGLEYLVTEQPMNLPLAFRSGAVRVYRLTRPN
jgi:hypothetical protein